METLTVETYTFDELSDAAKRTAREHMRGINVDSDFENVIDEAKHIGEILGTDISNVLFSGFSSQGDGACFEGRYQYRKGSERELREYAPVDEILHWIARNLFDVQRRNFYSLTAKIKHSGRYYHSRCTEIDVERSDGRKITAETERMITEILRSLIDWIYGVLDTERTYQMTDTAFDEAILANDYHFTAAGERKIYI